jgi:nucleoside-diphosphate-sugar epimerase
MRVFLTGPTGYVGWAVLDSLLRHGHHVSALVRTTRKAEPLTARGVHAVVGDLAKPHTYGAAAEACDVIVHTALDSKASAAVDRTAVETLVDAANCRAAEGHPAAFVYTSSLWVLGHTTDPAAEDAPVRPIPLVDWRPRHEQAVLASHREGAVRTAVIRPGIVYGGARGIIGDMLRDANNSLVRVVGDGSNHWPCVYDRDLADLYLRVVTNPEACGLYHANDEADERVDAIVESVARYAKTTPDVRHMPLPEARVKMGPLAEALALDQRVRSPRARALGWAPTLHSVAGNAARLLEEFRAAREEAA